MTFSEQSTAALAETLNGAGNRLALSLITFVLTLTSHLVLLGVAAVPPRSPEPMGLGYVAHNVFIVLSFVPMCFLLLFTSIFAIRSFQRCAKTVRASQLFVSSSQTTHRTPRFGIALTVTVALSLVVGVLTTVSVFELNSHAYILPSPRLVACVLLSCAWLSRELAYAADWFSAITIRKARATSSADLWWLIWLAAAATFLVPGFPPWPRVVLLLCTSLEPLFRVAAVCGAISTFRASLTPGQSTPEPVYQAPRS